MCNFKYVDNSSLDNRDFVESGTFQQGLEFYEVADLLSNGPFY